MVSPLRLKRFIKGLTLYDIRQETGIDTAKLSLMERGYVAPKPEEKEKLARALGCAAVEIFPPGTEE